MKKITAVLMAVLCLGLITSCQKKEKGLIVGTWNAKSFSQHMAYASGAQSAGTYEYKSGENIREFKSDYTFTVYTAGSLNGPYPYSIDGDKLTMSGVTTTFSVSETSLTYIEERDITDTIVGSVHITTTSVFERQ